jgi:hypothetical protein
VLFRSPALGDADLDRVAASLIEAVHKG